MSKAPEEGKIWEWRAFGNPGKKLEAKVRSYPLRLGIKDIRGEDLYLISPNSDQNVKLRRSGSGWVLKLKLLFESRTAPFELYSESAEFTYQLPVSVDQLQEAARLLATTLPPKFLNTTTKGFGLEEFINALGDSSPAVRQTRVSKVRSQFQFENGWLELADVQFVSRKIRSVSVHSPDIKVVKEMTRQLQPGKELEPMNYIEACRRWG